MNLNIFKFNYKNKNEIRAAVLKSVNVLKSGGIVVHPTDTCYGIAADINNKRAIDKVYNFKGRGFNNPLFIIVKDISQFKKCGCWDSAVGKLIRKNPNKMFTFVVDRKKAVPTFLNPNFETVGIQMPKNDFSLTLLKKFKSPLIGTSANLSNQPVNYSIKDLLSQLAKKRNLPDLILDAGKLPSRGPSSVVKFEKGKVIFLRK
jgi:L-threonylcarbamoyladenylate synthase